MNSKAMVGHTGNVFWPPPAKFRSSCKIDITYFPFDDQTCELKFGSWTYDGFQVDITNRSDSVDLNNYVFSGEWELIDVRIKRMEITYACCIEPYPDVRFTIIIRRKTLYYLFNIIFPCLWLTILSLLGFWLPPDSGEKITLGITVLLAFSVFMLLIAESMPATSEFVPLIGIYLTVTMGMTSLSIILTVFVLQLHHVGPHKRPVPRWLRTIICDMLARLVCMSRESQPFSTRYQVRHYYTGGGEKRERVKGKPSRQHPQVVVEPSDNSVTQLSGDDSGRGKIYTFDPLKGINGSDTEDGNGGIRGTEGTKLRAGSNSPSLPASSGQKSRSTRLHGACNNDATKTPSSQDFQVSRNSSRRNNCNGDVFIHESLSPLNASEKDPSGLEFPASSARDRQCREYSFHEPSPYTLGPEQMGAGFSGAISRSPSFRSRSSSFRGDHYRASFRRGFPIVRDTASYDGFPESSTAAGGGGAYSVDYMGGGAFTDATFESYQQLVMEWQFIAHVMDRLLFWLFLFVALVSSIAILVIKPMFKPPLQE
ncbi:neuronal acetylcholine receptor subunit alpha-10 [Plakobranchus ocellatus]|uniref:Neuronal acetylcholine receptor subunit alpha-10 n=1 Tax=Plakobranchus ocellatus TaxID=259542 RepID=A0AAV4AA55_9GAST|nr:neuronal acetylcholine receptor subunit alpha-10 [Plakobranchus ocellatus]